MVLPLLEIASNAEQPNLIRVKPKVLKFVTAA